MCGASGESPKSLSAKYAFTDAETSLLEPGYGPHPPSSRCCVRKYARSRSKVFAGRPSTSGSRSWPRIHFINRYSLCRIESPSSSAHQCPSARCNDLSAVTARSRCRSICGMVHSGMEGGIDVREETMCGMSRPRKNSGTAQAERKANRNPQRVAAMPMPRCAALKHTARTCRVHVAELGDARARCATLPRGRTGS